MKGTETWASDPQVSALRIEPTPGHSLLLPFDQFVYGELTETGPESRLELFFATHEVNVQGHALRRLWLALQRRELASIAPTPESARPAIPDGHPVLRRITVTRVEDQEVRTSAGQT